LLPGIRKYPGSQQRHTTQADAITTEGPMTIAQYLRLLRDRWILVALLATCGLLGAGMYSVLAMPTYEAETQLFISTSGQNTDVRDLAQAGSFTQQRVKSYADLLTSPRVLDPVIKQLNLHVTAEDLAGQVTATSPLDTVLIDVTVKDTSPQRAADTANAIATAFPSLVNTLETPRGQQYSPVKVSITRQAVPPQAPVAPRKALNLALGLLVGLGLGVGAAVLRDSLDRTIGGRNKAGDIAKAPVLGGIADDPDVSSKPLIIHDAFSPRAEAFRQLRTNIRFLGVDHRVTSLVVTSSVQAEGKSTTAANLAIALAQAGENVVLIDADLRRPTVAALFGLTGGIGLTSVLVGDAPLDQTLQTWRDDLPLRVLATGPLPPNPSELIGSTRMSELVHWLTGQGATVIIDSPPLLPVTDAAILARITDGALLITRIGATRVEQLSAAADALRTAGAPILGLLLNRVPRKHSSYRGGYHHDYTAYAPRNPSTEAPDPLLVQPLAVQLGEHPAPQPFPAATAQAAQPNGITELPWPFTPRADLNGYGRRDQQVIPPRIS
jgi:succinoglycan biosynthesis transport protein ExoP